MTRAFIALGHGDVEAAVLLNPASPPIYVGAIAILGLSLYQAIRAQEALDRTWHWVRWAGVPVVLALMSLAWLFNLTRHVVGG